jgi:NADPH:quinone reductase-like Zn-dependent oxidoreductase
VIAKHGGPEELVVRRTSVRPPGPGEARIRQTAIGVNYIDVYVRTGFYPMLTPPGTPGMEAAGQVIDVGEGVVGILPGDRVAYACPPVGAYCDVRTMKADQLVVLPADIDDETAAALMLKGMSAEYLLRRTHRVERGETVLVHSAAGGVGLLLCQWAKHLGATVIGTVGSADKARLAREHGCDVPIVHSQGDFVADVMEATRGRGADVIYDGVGGANLDRSFEALATCGHLVSYGEAGGPASAFDAHRMSSKSATVSRPVLFDYTAQPERLREMSANVFDLVRRRVLRVPVHQRYRLADAAEAHRALEGRATTGATVLLP